MKHVYTWLLIYILFFFLSPQLRAQPTSSEELLRSLKAIIGTPAPNYTITNIIEASFHPEKPLAKSNSIRFDPPLILKNLALMEQLSNE